MRLSTSLVVLTLLGALTACAGEAEPEREPTEPRTFASEETETPAPEEQEPAEEEQAAPDGMDPELAAQGVTPDLLRTIEAVGARTGYTLQGGDPAEAAFLGIAICSRVAEGRTSFAQERQDAIADGAPPAAAAEWNDYLEQDFCPSLG